LEKKSKKINTVKEKIKMKKYHVRILVEVVADNKKDAIVEARNTIYGTSKDEEFLVY